MFPVCEFSKRLEREDFMKKMIFYCDVCDKECKETFDARILIKTRTPAEREIYGEYYLQWKDLCKECAEKLVQLHNDFMNWGEQQ